MVLNWYLWHWCGPLLLSVCSRRCRTFILVLSPLFLFFGKMTAQFNYLWKYIVWLCYIFSSPKNLYYIINLIMLFAKSHIQKSKCSNYKPSFVIFENEVKQYINSILYSQNKMIMGLIFVWLNDDLTWLFILKYFSCGHSVGSFLTENQRWGEETLRFTVNIEFVNLMFLVSYSHFVSIYLFSYCADLFSFLVFRVWHNVTHDGDRSTWGKVKQEMLNN